LIGGLELEPKNPCKPLNKGRRLSANRRDANPGQRPLTPFSNVENRRKGSLARISHSGCGLGPWSRHGRPPRPWL